MDIKDKIRKILEKAQSTSYDAEADALFTKARQMMEEHQVSTFDLQAGTDPISTRRTNAFQKGTPASMRYWMEGEVALFYGCEPVTLTFTKRRGTKPEQCLELIGPESALVTTEVMFPFIWKQITRSVNKATPGDKGEGRKLLKKVCDAFALRLRRLRRQAHRTSPLTPAGKNALVVIGSALEAFVKARYPEMGEAPDWKPQVSWLAQELAQGISIDPQMGKRVEASHRIGVTQ